jgi:cytoskeletal protein CcmA (bactofilin family)
LSLIVLGLIGGQSALAQDKPDETIDTGEFRNTATMLAGQFIRMAGSVPDFMGAGRTVTITGEVRDNALAFGQSVMLDEGRIDGDFLAMGEIVLIDGEVAGDVYAGCKELRVTSRGVIHGNLYIGAETVIIDGLVTGILQGGANTIRINSELGGGDIDIGRSGKFVLGPDAHINGDLRYRASSEAEIHETTTLTGEFEFSPYAPGAYGKGGFSLKFFLWSWVAAMIVGLVLLKIAGSWMRASAASLSDNAAQAFVWGALFFLVTPLVALLVMITVIGVPLGIISAVVYGLAIYLASLPLSLWLGDWILRKVGRPAPGAFLSLSLGLLIYNILGAIPWLGPVIVMGTLILGLGAMFLGCRKLQMKLNA